MSIVMPYLRKGQKFNTKDRYNELFQGKNRIYFPFHSNQSSHGDTYEKVNQYLSDNKYKILDYKSGLAVEDNPNETKEITDKQGIKRVVTKKPQPINISKVLATNPQLQNEYNDLRSKTGVKIEKEGLSIVLSRHPYDIAGSSTGRGWTSCMNLEDGCRINYIMKDVKEGSLVAYLIKSKDAESKSDSIKNPLARILIKPHEHASGSEETILAADPVYGQDFEGFRNAVQKIVNKLNTNMKDGMYTLHPKLYQDGKTAIALKIGDNVYSGVEGRNDFVRKYKDYEWDNLPQELDKYKNTPWFKKGWVLQHPELFNNNNKIPPVLNVLIKNILETPKNSWLFASELKFKNVPPEVIRKISEDPVWSFYFAQNIKFQNVPPEIEKTYGGFDGIVKDPEKSFKYAVELKFKNIPPEIEQSYGGLAGIAKDPEMSFEYALNLKFKNVPHEVILKIAEDPEKSFECATELKFKNIPPDIEQSYGGFEKIVKNKEMSFTYAHSLNFMNIHKDIINTISNSPSLSYNYAYGLNFDKDLIPVPIIQSISTKSPWAYKYEKEALDHQEEIPDIIHQSAKKYDHNLNSYFIKHSDKQYKNNKSY